MKNYYFCDDLEWEGLANCTDPRQALRHIQIIDFSLRQQLEKELKEFLNTYAEQEFINVDLICFDPEIEYYPQSYWEVSLVFFTWSRNIVSVIHDFLTNFCEVNKTWFSIWIDAHPMYVILFPDSEIVFQYSSLGGRDKDLDKHFALKVAKYGLGIEDEKLEGKIENWPEFLKHLNC